MSEDLFYLPTGINFTDFYRQLFENKPISKIKRGEPLVTYPDKERRKCELSFTYLFKKGTFGKENRLIFVLELDKEDSVYKGKIFGTNVNLIVEDKAGLQSKWNGKLEEALNNSEIKYVVESFLLDIKEIKSKLEKTV